MTLVKDVSMEDIGAGNSNSTRPLEREASMSTIRSESPPPATPSTPTYRTRQLEAPRPPSDAPNVAYMVATPKTPRARASGDIEHMLYTFTYRNLAGDVVVVDPMSLDRNIKFKGALLHVSSVATGSQCADMQPVRDIFVSAPTRSAIACAVLLNAFLIAFGLGMALYELNYQTDLWHAFLLRGRF